MSLKMAGRRSWKTLPSPDEEITRENGAVSKPVATLESNFRGRAQIVVDDGCYVLLIQKGTEGRYVPSYHWWSEAVEAVQGLPLPHLVEV